MADDDHNNTPDGGIEPTAGTPFAPLGICARCHRPLTRPSTAGGCLHCIVDFVGLDEDSNFASATTGSEEVRRYSHFEIALKADGTLAELGHGSMGTTYRAEDTVLHSPVALKVIGRNVADSPTVRARFLREARSAARLRHPNVATVFHYGEQEGECFYVMELVEGETLEERVRRAGPLPMQSVLEIGVQVARALEAAETQGLVHRDLKPSNLMLVGGQGGEGKPNAPLVVKVIDFGLAKAVAAGEQATGENDTRHGFVGTPAYASPEQFSARDHPVDTRSDLYSLGATLWYLLCGRTPFRGATLEEIHAKQVSQTLPIDQLTARRVPASVVALLRSMLSVDPGARPQSARELLDVLQRCQEKLMPSHRRPWVIILGLLALGVPAAVFVLMRPDRTPRNQPPASEVNRSVAVLPFTNLSPDLPETFFTSGVQEDITGDLARIKALKVIGADSTRIYPPGNRDPVRIAGELEVSHLIEGSVRRQGDQVQVSVQLIDPLGKVAPWTKQYHCRVQDIFTLESQITREVAERLQVTLSPGEKAIIAEQPTTDPVAYDLYLRASKEPNLYNDATEMRRGLTKRIAWLDEAVARDPNFVLAYCALVNYQDAFLIAGDGATPEERAIDHRALADSALQNARRLGPDNGKVHQAIATHFYLATHDTAQARIEAELALRTLPNDAELDQLIGLIARSQGRLEDAVRALEDAISLVPNDPVNFHDLQTTLRPLRRYEETQRVNARLIALQKDNTYDRIWGAEIPLEEKGDPEPLRAALAAAPPPNASDSGYRIHDTLLLALYTRDSDGIASVLASWKKPIFAFHTVPYPTVWFEGLAARMRGDAAGARTAFTAARDALKALVDQDPASPLRLSLLAITDAGLGNKDDAIREGQRAIELAAVKKAALTDTFVRCQLAVVYAWTDQPDLSFGLLEELASKPTAQNLLHQVTYGDLQFNPVWDPLRTNPRFSSLVKRLAPKDAH